MSASEFWKANNLERSMSYPKAPFAKEGGQQRVIIINAKVELQDFKGITIELLFLANTVTLYAKNRIADVSS